ncbi:hypothetical protein ACFX2G_027194 [Malus domestica]
MILMFSTIICLREFVALVISEIEAFDCTRFPAIEVMEMLDKAKCVVLIGSTMGGMRHGLEFVIDQMSFLVEMHEN